VDLIDLIQKLVDDPQEREAFQEAPEQYVALQEELLQPYLHKLLGPVMPMETGTVMSIRSRKAIGEVATEHHPSIPPGAIHLAGLPVFLRPRTPFFIEYQYHKGSHENYHTYTCMLLKHSYIEFIKTGPDRTTNMRLHLCFVDPQDQYDQPQVVVISAGDEQFEPEDHNLADTVVYLSIRRGSYILLRGDAKFPVLLDKYSYYDEQTNEIYLSFDARREPPPQ
jgi:hypothetical protein